MDKIKENILEKVKPTEKEKNQMNEIVKNLQNKVKEISSDMNIDIKPILVGSTARGTWLSGEQDIDLFLLFPQETDRCQLEKLGLEIGKKVSEGKGKEQYAEHPYINTRIDGFDIDIVPCYNVDDPSEPQSSVDRTPHHQNYIEKNLENEQTTEVLLLKKFLKGVGTYGSELKVHGFSGYLSELLIIHYETFDNLIESVKKWDEKKVIAPNDNRSKKDLKKAFPESPLILIDPVDPSRNVAAALSKENYAKFVRAAESFSQSPDKKFFFPNPPLKNKNKIRQMIKKRKSKIFLINLELDEEIVHDILYPQLRKTERKLRNKLEREDFKVIRSRVWAGKNKAAVIIELDYPKISKVNTHEGPPLGISVKPFLEKHKNSEKKLTGPYIDKKGKMVFELERKQNKARKILEKSLKDNKGLGKNIKKALEKNSFKIVEDENTIKEAEQLCGVEILGEYLDKKVPWQR
mgnify:CR=1 FL=1